jgi:transcriptional regulator with XRE-family HTH domain
MKLKLGAKLYGYREEKKMNQTEMADLLGMTTSTYARLERGETSLSIEELPKIAERLGIGINELLPETITIHNGSHNHQGGIVFGNINNFYGGQEMLQELQERIRLLEMENQKLKTGLN